MIKVSKNKLVLFWKKTPLDRIVIESLHMYNQEAPFVKYAALNTLSITCYDV